ncbi:hypothetical protein PT974_03771 [Cladobotryum mycophilum]|uniref:Rhodopsin domain-containing protein n=1 Tax=Cladobotryum mycophilum TaxID=491253 RepID=A0ABR0ST94_9HYPO
MAWAYNTPDGTANNAPTIVAVALSVTILALISLLLRLYVRIFMLKNMGLDDWIIIVAWIGGCGYTVATIVQTKWGLGLVHIDDMPDQNIINFGVMQYIGAPFYVIGIWGFKVSLLVSYVRLVPPHYRIVPIIVASITTAAHVAFILVFLFMCSPIDKIWKPLVPGHCVEQVTFYLTFSSLTIIFDVVTLVLPFPVLVKLQMKLRKKLVLLGLFALGIFVTIVQIIRIQTIESLSDYLDSAESIKWSIVETAVGIIIACVPTLAPLVKSFAERTRNTSGGSGSAGLRVSPIGGGSGSGSEFAHNPLQSWRGAKSGMKCLGTGVDRDEPEEEDLWKGLGEGRDSIPLTGAAIMMGIQGAGSPRHDIPIIRTEEV